MHMKLTCLVGDEALMDADPRGRLSRKHRVCGGKPTARTIQPTATDDAALAENVWIEDGEGRSEPREVSLGRNCF